MPAVTASTITITRMRVYCSRERKSLFVALAFLSVSPLVGVDKGCCYNLACLGHHLEGGHTAAAACLKRVGIKGSAFTVAIGAEYKDASLGVNGFHGDQAVSCDKANASHTTAGSGGVPQVG